MDFPDRIAARPARPFGMTDERAVDEYRSPQRVADRPADAACRDGQDGRRGRPRRRCRFSGGGGPGCGRGSAGERAVPLEPARPGAVRPRRRPHGSVAEGRRATTASYDRLEGPYSRRWTAAVGGGRSSVFADEGGRLWATFFRSPSFGYGADPTRIADAGAGSRPPGVDRPAGQPPLRPAPQPRPGRRRVRATDGTAPRARRRRTPLRRVDPPPRPLAPNALSHRKGTL